MIDPGSFLAVAGPVSDLGKALIEKVAEAIGGILKPWQTKRVMVGEAEGEAEANLIRAQSRLEISDLEMRGVRRQIREGGQHQENMEGVLQKAVPLLTVDAKPETMARDWIIHAFDRLRLVSDDEMQSLWASIIAGEANAPGSFSKKTLDLVASLEKVDAEQFTKLCSCLWYTRVPTLMVFDVPEEVLKDYGITFDSVSHLEYLGILHTAMVESYSAGSNSKEIPLTYYGRFLDIKMPPHLGCLPYGNLLLTQAGRQLAKICGSAPVEACYLHAVQH